MNRDWLLLLSNEAYYANLMIKIVFCFLSWIAKLLILSEIYQSAVLLISLHKCFREYIFSCSDTCKSYSKKWTVGVHIFPLFKYLSITTNCISAAGCEFHASQNHRKAYNSGKMKKCTTYTTHFVYKTMAFFSLDVTEIPKTACVLSKLLQYRSIHIIQKRYINWQ